MTLEQARPAAARKMASRRKLLNAARKLFAERGYHDTRPQDIAREAGVGHGTFYLHFADKRECFLAFANEAADEIHDAVVGYARDKTNMTDVIRSIFCACRDYNRKYPGVLAAAMLDASIIHGSNDLPGACLVDRWAQDWEVRIRDLQTEGLISKRINPSVFGHAIVGACCQAINGSMRSGIEDEEVIDDIIVFISNALGLKPSR
jgi:AcrR family transcriptional regulator